MPAELFRSVQPSTPATRRASLLPVSIAAHIAAIAAAVLFPIVADGELPSPVGQPSIVTIIDDLPPPPPAVKLKPPPSQQAPTTSPNKPPIEAPAVINPESAFELSQSFEPNSGDDDGAPFGVKGSIGPPVAPLPPPPPVERKPIKVGGLIQAPRRIVSIAPIYPQAAQQARIDGAVTIEALIGEDGKVRNATVIRGKPMLSEAALTAVRQWVFTPTRLNGEPVAVIMTVTVVFSLN
jgi:protein TonB